MKIKVIITIDTEEDTWDHYSAEKNPVANIQQIPSLQHLFDRYGAKPTYLVNYPVATDPQSVSIINKLLENNSSEIGAHCHPWNTPPFREPIGKVNSMICNLPPNLQYEKLYSLTEAIKEAFGTKPISFRAGRWGFGPETAVAIDKLGYRIDTSISPTMDWRAHGGPDFSFAPFNCYRFNCDNILSPVNQGRLLEIPPTVGFLQRNFRRCTAIRKIFEKPFSQRLHILGILERTGLLNRRWLSPELSSSKDLIRLTESFIEEEHSFLNMSFHSTSLLPGRSPFVKTEADLSNFLNRIETFLKYSVSKGYLFSRISEFTDT
jgi:hypothetical protein